MRIYKLTVLFIHILAAVLFTVLFAGLLRIPSQEPRYRKGVIWWHQRVCNILGIQVSIVGKPAKKTVLYVSNHVSWMDISLLASIVDPHFLSKAEVRSWPLIGWIGEKAGTLFIARGSRSAATSAQYEMASCLTDNKTRHGHSVLFFPEGTTHTGQDILRFRQRLFDAAIETATPVQPIVLYYPHPQQQGVNPKVPFVGEQSLISNIWLLLGEKKIAVTVSFLPLINSKATTRKELATLSETQVRKRLLNLIEGKK